MSSFFMITLALITCFLCYWLGHVNGQNEPCVFCKYRDENDGPGVEE